MCLFSHSILQAPVPSPWTKSFLVLDDFPSNQHEQVLMSKPQFNQSKKLKLTFSWVKIRRANFSPSNIDHSLFNFLYLIYANYQVGLFVCYSSTFYFNVNNFIFIHLLNLSCLHILNESIFFLNIYFTILIIKWFKNFFMHLLCTLCCKSFIYNLY